MQISANKWNVKKQRVQPLRGVHQRRMLSPTGQARTPHRRRPLPAGMPPPTTNRSSITPVIFTKATRTLLRPRRTNHPHRMGTVSISRLPERGFPLV